jgi:zinc protease
MSEPRKTPNKSGRPQPLPPRPYAFPRFERRRLSNGLTIVVAPVSKMPLATVIALVDGGAVCGSRGKEGVARLTSTLLLEGTQTMDGAALAEKFEQLGASIDASAGWDGSSIAMTVLSAQLPAAVKLLGEVIRTPAFPQREVDRLKAERLAELLQLRTEPRGLADEMFTKVLYESTSRYSVPEAGTETSVASIQRDDIQRFYETRFCPPSVTLIFAGDITVDRVEKLVADTFGDWSGKAPSPCSASDKPARTTRATHIVAKPDAAQSELRIGQVWLPRKHPDYYESVVLNAVLGGVFSSRINLNLRERHGYTYGAFSSLEWRRQAGPWVVSTAVQSEVTVPAIRETIYEIENIRKAKITDDELSLVTSFLDGVFPIRYETTEAIAGAIAALVQYDLADDFYDTYRDQVRKVTADGVLRVAREHLRDDTMQLLVVGNPASIHKPLEEFGFGPLTVYNTGGEIIDD